MAERTTNPRGDLTPLGGDWPEARSFVRTYGGNPYAQAKLAQTLVGLLKNPLEQWKPGHDKASEQILPAEAVVSITGTIRYLCQEFGEFLSEEPVKLDPDFGMSQYPGCDPLLKTQIREVLERDLSEL